MRRIGLNAGILVLALVALSSCGMFRSGAGTETRQAPQYTDPDANPNNLDTENTVWQLFGRKSAENTGNVNRYLWAASLEVLSFLPVESVDPFTGVIVTGYGTPPGGSRAYRATVLIDDPALSARSLTVSMQSRSGAVSSATTQAIESAILDRARQLRSADNAL